MYGSVWEYMGVYGSVWEYMGVYGSILWEYMGVYGEYFGDGIFFWLSHFQKVRKIRRNRRKSQLGLNDLASNLPPNLRLPASQVVHAQTTGYLVRLTRLLEKLAICECRYQITTRIEDRYVCVRQCGGGLDASQDICLCSCRTNLCRT